jgi:beta-phosphoglucomutase-like phosphatase (HAD superfamily)
MPLRAVVFDFDGVIADTEPLHLKAAQRALAAAGMRLDATAYYERYLGFDDAGLFRALATDIGVDLDAKSVATLVEDKSRVLESLIDDGSVLFAGIRDCIERCAAHVPLAIASGALAHEVDDILRRTGLRHVFQAVVGAGDTPRSKPEPDPYARAVELLRVGSLQDLEPAQCVAIEDSPWGLQSARSAGLRCVAVAHTYSVAKLREEADADFIAESLGDITIERLQQLCA